MKYLRPCIIYIFSFSLVASAAAFGAEPSGAPADALAALVDQALANNPDLRVAEERWQMFERKVIPAQTLDDPRLGFAFSNYPVDSLEGNETPMTGKEIQLSQMFPFPGKLGAKGELAEQQALWYKGAWEDAKLQLTQKVKDAWYRLYYQDKAIGITQKNIDILDDFIRLTETRYEVGTGLQQDVLKAQVERSRLMDRLFTLRQQRTTVLADLNTLLSRSTTSPLNPAEELDMTPVEPSLEALQELSRERRPLYNSYQSLIDRFESQRKLARLDYYPDFNVWAGYRIREEVMGDPVPGTDFVSAGVSINLPIWREKRSEVVAEAESGIRMARRQYDDFRNRVHFTINDAYAQMEKNRDLVSLFKTGIIPQAQQSFEASLAAYQVGDVDFLNLLDSLLTLYRYEIDYHRVLADYQRNVAQIEAAAGVSFEKTPEATPDK